MGALQRLAGLGAATAVAAALAVGLPTAAHAATYCSGNVIDQMDGNGFSSRLIQSYDGGSICVNTWNQTGHQAWTWAFIHYTNGANRAQDYGNYYQYASTGFVNKSGCWQWGGVPNSSGVWIFRTVCY